MTADALSSAVPQSRPLVAFAWILGATASFALMAVAGRQIQTEMNTFELMLYRSGIGFVIVATIIRLKSGGFAQVRTTHPWEHARRNVIHFTGQNLWFYAIAAIPLGQLVALEFTNPLWVALLAPLMLSESLTRRRLLAALIGFAGVLVVARPGTSALEIGHGAALGAALLFALTNIMTKKIMRDDSVLCIIFWMSLSQTAMALILSLPGGIPPPTSEMAPWLLAVGICGLTAHFSLSSALGAAPAIIVAPMEFIRLPVFVVMGALIYGEELHVAVLIGALMIIGGNLLNLRGETRRARP